MKVYVIIVKDNSIRSYTTQFKRGEVVTVSYTKSYTNFILRSVVNRKRFIYTSKESLNFHIKDNAILPFKKEI